MQLFTLLISVSFLVSVPSSHGGVIRTENVPIVYIVGGPGSGKGTHCAKIVEKFGFSHFSVGDLLRAEVSAGTEKGKEYAEMMSKGGLLSGEDIAKLLENAIRKELGKTNGFLIDGFPRSKQQAEHFERLVPPIDAVISLECKADTMVARIMKRVAESETKRDDDNEETIKARIETYHKNADDVVSMYPNKVAKIDGERSIDEVFVDVSKVISNVLANKSKNNQ